MNESNDLLTIKEAAKFLRLSPLTLWRLRKRGKLPYIRLASKVFYSRADLEAWIERNKRNREATK